MSLIVAQCALISPSVAAATGKTTPSANVISGGDRSISGGDRRAISGGDYRAISGGDSRAISGGDAPQGVGQRHQRR